MTQIHDLGVNLENSAFVCRNGRNNLQSAKEEIAKRILIILAKYRRKKIYTVTTNTFSLFLEAQN